MQNASSQLECNLAAFTESISRRYGLNLNSARISEIKRNLQAAVNLMKLASIDELVTKVIAGKLNIVESQVLIGCLTVGETYFFRDPDSFNALRTILMTTFHCDRPEPRPLNIWSAACCTGEETYSIAIAVHELCLDPALYPARIVGTDINHASVEHAKQGTYSEWSFRGASETQKQLYFLKAHDGPQLKIAPRIRQTVDFKQHNLVDDNFYVLWRGETVDVIFCRNVLMYFTPDKAMAVVQKLYDALSPGGHLFMSPAELGMANFLPFEKVTERNSIVLRKPDETKRPRGSVTHSNKSAKDNDGEHSGVKQAVKDAMGSGKKSAVNAVNVDELYAAGEFEQIAQHIIETELPSASEPEKLLFLIRCLINSRKHRKALEILDEMAVNSISYYMRAIIYLEQNSVQDSIVNLRNAIRLDNDFIAAQFCLANQLRAIGDTRQAVKHLERAMKLLESYSPEQVVPASEGLTADELRSIIRSLR